MRATKQIESSTHGLAQRVILLSQWIRYHDHAGARPHVFHEKLLEHHEPQPLRIDGVHLVGEPAEGFAQLQQLDAMAAVEGDLLGVGDDARVHMPQVTVACSLFGDQLPELGRHLPQNQSGRRNHDERERRPGYDVGAHLAR